MPSNPLGVPSNIKLSRSLMEQLKALAKTADHRTKMCAAFNEVLFVADKAGSACWVLSFRADTHIRTVIIGSEGFGKSYVTVVVNDLTTVVPKEYDESATTSPAINLVNVGQPFHHCGGSDVGRPYTVKAGRRADEGEF